MNELAYTLLTDGTSDQVLLPVLTWILRLTGVHCPIRSAWADLRRLPSRPQDLTQRIKSSLELYPCRLLFVHRDAERESREWRANEIARAAAAVRGHTVPPVVCVVPVRMQEAWLLVDESAIRRAAGNPHGSEPLSLPAIKDLEGVPDPKGMLHSLLREASGLRGQRKRRFNERAAARRVVGYCADFASLRSLTAFAVLEADVRRVVRELGFDAG